MRVAVICLLAVIIAPVFAQSLHQCIDKRGHISLTSAPCAPGQQTQKVVDATPERMTPERAAYLEQRRRQDDVNSAYLRRLAGHDQSPVAPSSGRKAHRVDLQAARCQAAKAQRETTLQRVGLKRTHTLL